MKPFDVKGNTYFDFGKGSDDKNPKFKVGDNLKASKYKDIFAKGYTLNWSEEFFVIKKVKNTVTWTYVVSDFSSEEIVGAFNEKELLKTTQTKFRVEEVRNRKGNKLYVK